MTDEPRRAKDIRLDEIFDDDETKEIPIPVAKPDLPYCLAKKYEARMIEKGAEIIRPDACTNKCDGRDSECLYWIAQNGPGGKGWKTGGDE